MDVSMKRLRVRFSLQWLVVVVAIAAILMCAAVEVAPDVAQRWRRCNRMADEYAAKTKWWAAQKPRAGLSAEVWNQEHSYIIRSIKYFEEKSWMYRRALFLPWEFYSLGATFYR
jgi:hypothetical protein